MAGEKGIKATERSVRLVRRGDVVRLPDGTEEVVRDVQVVLQLANGSNAPFTGRDKIEILPPEDLPDET